MELIIKPLRLLDGEEVTLLNGMTKEYKTTQDNNVLFEIMKLSFVDSVKLI